MNYSTDLFLPSLHLNHPITQVIIKAITGYIPSFTDTLGGAAKHSNPSTLPPAICAVDYVILASHKLSHYVTISIHFMDDQWFIYSRQCQTNAQSTDRHLLIFEAPCHCGKFRGYIWMTLSRQKRLFEITDLLCILIETMCIIVISTVNYLCWWPCT